MSTERAATAALLPPGNASDADVGAPPATADVLLRLVAAVERLERASAAEALGPAEAAEFLGISVATLHRMNADGLLPLPVELGLGNRCPRWPRTELKAWLIAGTPTRQKWQAMRATALKQTA